jgi:WD40 repeat protein
VKLWEAETGQENRTLLGHTNFVWGVAFSPDGRRLASAGGDGVRVWGAVTGEAVGTWPWPLATVSGLAFSPDGRRLALASRGGKVKVVDAATGQEVLVTGGTAVSLSNVVFSPDDKRLAAAVKDAVDTAGSVILWDAATGEETLKLSPGSKVHHVAFSPDGYWLAATCQDGTVRVWDATPLPPQPAQAAAAAPK